MIKQLVFVLSLLVSSMASSVQLAVLCYHHVDFTRAKDYNVSSAQLSSHLQALKTAGFKFVSMKDVQRFYRGEDAIPSRSALITFDDGNINTYTTAWPILKRHKVPMTMFVYPTAISAGHKYGFMDWDQVKEMSNGGVEIGAHGFDHPYLPFPPKTITKREQFDDWLKHQTHGTKELIEKRISRSVTALALPFGLSDFNSYYAIKNAGYFLAFNISGMTNDNRSDRLYLNRIMVVEGDSDQVVVRKALTRPLKLLDRQPFSLGRIFTPTTNIHFMLSKEDQVITSSVRVAFSAKGFGPTNYHSLTGYNWSVGLPRDQVYSVSVFAKNKSDESCFGSWSFIKHEKPPIYWR